MTFTEIRLMILPLWGSSIDISDAHFVDIDNSEPGFFCPALSAIWDKVENDVGYENPFLELMVWTVFQLLQDMAKELFIVGHAELQPQAIDLNDLEKRYFENLNSKEWEFLLKEYERN